MVTGRERLRLSWRQLEGEGKEVVMRPCCRMRAPKHDSHHLHDINCVCLQENIMDGPIDF